MTDGARSIEVLLVEDDPGDVLLTKEAFDDNKLSNNLHVVCDGEEATAYLRRQGPRYVGHNPLGGWMILLLLALSLAEAASGLPANDAIMNAGPLYGLVTPEQSDAFTHWHARLWPALVAAIAAHIAAAILYLWPGGTNLIAPLLTGYRSGVAPDQGIAREHRWRALIILAILIVLLVVGLALAPPADLVPLSAAQCSSSRYLS